LIARCAFHSLCLAKIIGLPLTKINSCRRHCIMTA